VKYAPENTQVRVRLQFAKQAVTVQVRDEGPGIPDEDIPHIFDKYYRGMKADKEQQGAGLGLALVKAIVTAHDGEITVQNVPAGGAMFTVTLPGSLRASEAD
jgi:two-component system OmpR family sensor kinase